MNDTRNQSINEIELIEVEELESKIAPDSGQWDPILS